MESIEVLKKINHLIGETEAVYHQSSVKFGISDSVNKILYALFTADGKCSLSDICFQTGLSKQTVNSALRQLEKDKIICSQAIDGKSKLILLTDKGYQFTSQNTARLVDIELQVFSQWTEQEVEQYITLTERYLVSFRQLVDKL